LNLFLICPFSGRLERYFVCMYFIKKINNCWGVIDFIPK
ncbi:MAG: hypothetical protein ACI9XB_001596, partial [Gammaproteobacteria bacterium]